MSATGTWNVTMSTPMGAQPATLELAEEDGKLTGTMSSAAAPAAMEIADGTADGDSLAWTVAMTSPMAMTLEFAATVDGDAIAGTVKLGTFGDASFEGTRA
ncbi:MAG: hypothetical protein ACHQIG_01445 [Acidimicrobiia bacterium]